MARETPLFCHMYITLLAHVHHSEVNREVYLRSMVTEHNLRWSIVKLCLYFISCLAADSQQDANFTEVVTLQWVGTSS
jgi:hypothetical protein